MTLIGDFVVEYEGDTPILEARESGEVDGRWHEGNLPPSWVLAAGLQKVVGATFDESARPGGRDERFNQALWLLLLDVAKLLARTGAILVPRSGYEMTSSRWTEHLLEQDVDDLAGAVDLLLARAERYGLVTATETTIKRAVQEEQPPTATAPTPAEESEGIPATEYAIVVAPLYPDSSVGSHAVPSPFEQGFLDIASALRTVSENLGAAGVDLPGHRRELTQIASAANNVVNRTDRKATPRSTVRARLRQADELLPVLLSEGVYKLVSDWATGGEFSVVTDRDADQEAEPAAATAGAEPTSTQAAPSFGEFAPMHELLADREIAYSLVTTANTENQVLVVQDLDPEAAAALQNSYAEASPGRKGQDRRTQRLPVVEVRRSPPEEPIELPQEVITNVESNPHKGYIAWFISLFADDAATTEGQVTENLAGWTVFPLSPDAVNLGELREVLSKVSYLSVGSTEPE